MARKVRLYTVTDPTEQELNSSTGNPFPEEGSTPRAFFGEKTAATTTTKYKDVVPTLEEMATAAPTGHEPYVDEQGVLWFAKMIGDEAYYYRTNMEAPIPEGTTDFYCFFVPDGTDSKLAKFGTLKKMFSAYKQKSDAALDARLADLPSGGGSGLDAASVDAAIDAKLETYTTERNAYVDAAVAQGTSGLATAESVTGAVDSAKTELRGEMPKPYDFVSNSDWDADGMLTAKMINLTKFEVGITPANRIDLSLIRPSATSSHTRGVLCIQKSDIEAVIDTAIEAKMAEVREAVNGVLLFEELAAPTADVELPDVDVSAYERFTVTLRCEVTTGGTSRRSIQSVDVYAAELDTLNTGSIAMLYKPVVFVVNKSLLNKYMVSNVIYRFNDNAARTGLYVVGTWAYDANVILDPQGGVTQGDESMGDVLVSVERIVGHKKLPEVS